MTHGKPCVKIPACRTHGKPCVNMHACRIHGKPCVTMHAGWRMYKWEFVEEGRSRKKEEKRKERKEREERKRERRRREREGEERERERGRKGSRRSDGQNSLDQDVKVVYSTRATLKEVGILPPLVYFHPKGLFVKYGNATRFDPTHWPDVSTGFRLENKENLDSSPS